MIAVERRVARGADDVDLRPVAVEFFHDKGGDAEIRALPHLELRRMDQDPVFRRDLDIGLERVGRCRCGLRACRIDRDQPVADDKSGGRCDADEKLAAGGLRGG